MLFVGFNGATNRFFLNDRGRLREVRIYEPGTRRLLGARLVDTGSSYNAQSDIPLHFGLGSAMRVDVEVIWPGGSRTPVRRQGVGASSSRVVAIEAR